MNDLTLENIAIFAIFVVLFSTVVLFYHNETPEDVYAMIYMTPMFIVAIMSLSLARRYRKIAHFYYGHIVLGIGITFMILAEITWRLMDYWNLPQYQSFPDIFYLAYGVTLIFHPWIIMRHFKVKPKKIAWLIFAVCVVGGNGIYTVISIDYLDADSFYFGLGFATLTNILLGSTVIAIITLHGTKIFRVWILLGVAFFINAAADLYYYSSENFSDWHQGDLVNIAWFIGDIVLIYALMEHRYKYSIKQKY